MLTLTYTVIKVDVPSCTEFKFVTNFDVVCLYGLSTIEFDVMQYCIVNSVRHPLNKGVQQ